jgi:hypothetical protein
MLLKSSLGKEDGADPLTPLPMDRAIEKFLIDLHRALGLHRRRFVISGCDFLRNRFPDRSLSAAIAWLAALFLHDSVGFDTIGAKLSYSPSRRSK